MSNIYIQEPPTNGKVLLKTTVGEIDIELWSKEAPLACRNFVQLCMEGYYDNVIFHRLVRGFIVQTGDPTGTGFGGESIYGKPFKDEFHSRLRFVRRGLLAMANGGDKDDNGSQFFFTLESTPELQNKHTIFGKVTGKTLYNMLRLGEGEVDQNEKPIYPQKIISAEILSNPFDDIEPREKPKAKVAKTKQEQARERVKGNKNFSLLSFGDEAEEEEEEITKAVEELKNKSKSSHDLLQDDGLSSVPVLDKNELDEENNWSKTENEAHDDQERLDRVREKLSFKRKKDVKKKIDDNVDADDAIEELDFFEEEKLQKKNREIDKAQEEFRKLKKQLLKDLKKEKHDAKIEPKEENNVVTQFQKEANKFKEITRSIKKKGEGREEQCWDLLQSFRNRLQKTRESINSKDDEGGDEDEPATSVTEYVNKNKNSWLIHRMHCSGEDEIVLARDANIRNEEDWFDIYDPRNPINKRRRKEGE